MEVKLLKNWGKHQGVLEIREEEIFSTFENSLHSLHDAYNLLIINTSPCNDKQKAMSLMSLLESSDISDMRKTSTLHWE